LGYTERRCWANLLAQLVSKIFNLCGHDPSTLQTDKLTDEQTDRQTTCDLKTALCTVVHRAVKSIANSVIMEGRIGMCIGV